MPAVFLLIGQPAAQFKLRTSEVRYKIRKTAIEIYCKTSEGY